MSKKNVNFIFSVGYRCYSPGFLKDYNLRKFSGPFDYLFIDLETSFKIINNNFDNYLHDIILFNKNEKKIDLFYKKYTNKIHENFYKLLEEDNIGYMIQNYNGINMIFNQNYLDDNTLDCNLYNWNTICCFHHHNIIDDSNIYKSLQYRYERFQNIINKYNETTALFYITKIVNCDNIIDYMNKIVKLKKENLIDCYLIIIVNCDNMEDNSYYNDVDKCLFIIKKVENYETQYSNKQTHQTDNNLNYHKEFNTILNYFTFNLIEKKDI